MFDTGTATSQIPYVNPQNVSSSQGAYLPESPSTARPTASKNSKVLADRLHK
jgi:hypothetical protein